MGRNLTVEEWNRLMDSKEPLHPDLEPHVVQTPIGLSLKHPLVYSIPMGVPAMANWQYARKQEVLAVAMGEKDWYTAIWLHERPYRLTTLMDIASKVRDEDYWTLVGDVWIDSENIFEHVQDWIDLFAAPRPGRESLMTSEERKALKAMPQPITIYRGFTPGVNESGLSWTTSLERATWFAKRFEDKDNPGDVVEAWIYHDDVAAHFTRRGENEIVALDLDAPQFECYLSDKGMADV